MSTLKVIEFPENGYLGEISPEELLRKVMGTVSESIEIVIVETLKDGSVSVTSSLENNAKTSFLLQQANHCLLTGGL